MLKNYFVNIFISVLILFVYYVVSTIFDNFDKFLFCLLNIVFFYFSGIIISKKYGLHISDPLIILSSLLFFYTFFPLLQVYFDIKFFEINSIYNYSDYEIILHSYRFIYFQFVLHVSYFTLRSIANFQFTLSKKNLFHDIKFDYLTFLIILIIFIIIIFLLIYLAAPVNSYYDNYTKYDHLTGIYRFLVSILKRLYWGMYPILLTFIFVAFKNNKFFIFFLVSLLCISDLMISNGSRINTFMIILQCFVLYSLIYKKISLKLLTISGLVIIIFMSMIEYIRLDADFDFDFFAMIPGEFNSLFFPSIEIYKFIDSNPNPDFNILLYFKDLFYFFPFFYPIEANPMDWYWYNFHPLSPVAPFTMGPIADSAFFGGFYSITLRGILLAINVYLIFYFLCYFKYRFFSLLIYSYLVSVSILVLKYSVFSYQEQLIKNLLPSLFILFSVKLLILFLRSFKR